MNSLDSTRILIVSDNLLTRAGLVALLADNDTFIISGQVSGGDDLPEAIELAEPDLAIIDLGWQTSNTLNAVREISESGISTLALLNSEDDLNDTLTAINGSSIYGILLRDADSDTLVAAIDAMLAELVVIDPTLASAAIQPNNAGPDEPLQALTPREAEVLNLLASGLTNKGIAQELGITNHTVKFHVNAIMGKLGAQSRTEAVVRAARAGLLAL